MFKDFGENIQSEKLEFMFLSVISSKLKVVIIGGGRAGAVKAESFSKKGCLVTVISPDFVEGFKALEQRPNVKFIRDVYKEQYISDKHLVVIATGDDSLNEDIKRHCEKLNKLYIYCPSYKSGMVVAPVQGETENIEFALHTKEGSPKTSKMLLDTARKVLKEYDSFVDYSCSLRKHLKGTHEKDEIMSFISTEDFKFFYDKGMQAHVLKMFYGGNYFEFEDSYKKEQACSDTDSNCD